MFSSSGPNILKYTCEKKRKEKQKWSQCFQKKMEQKFFQKH